MIVLTFGGVLAALEAAAFSNIEIPRNHQPEEGWSAGNRLESGPCLASYAPVSGRFENRPRGEAFSLLAGWQRSWLL